MRTQWRAGAGGYYGLDLNVLPQFFEHLEVHPDQRSDVFLDLQVMEGGALAVMHEKQEKERRK